MYTIKCDDYILDDPRGEEEGFITENPKVNLEVNTVGSCSFTIYNTHPHYAMLNRLRSIFSVSDEIGTIFRGRMTNDTIDFDLGKAVDLEGLMAFFNDSVVRPFAFPEDFLENAEYQAAAESGNVVAFFLKWLIDNHNGQVQPFQRFKLGRVTVADSNNYISRSNSDYSNTWETLKTKLFDSSLGGYLCIRYEDDGNYIDYLAEFETVNPQEIVFGENLLDLVNETNGESTYTAILPVGKDGLTISELADGESTEDIVKSGDLLYSKSGVTRYGWICAPVSETKWDDVTDAGNLRKKAVEWLVTSGMMLSNTVEMKAADLHFSDKEIQSFRIYRNAAVHSEPHGITQIFPMPKLDIDIRNPQNTLITVGQTRLTLTEQTGNKVNSAAQKIESVEKDLKAEVSSTKNSVDALEVTIVEQNTSLINTCENIVFSAMQSYVERKEYEEFTQNSSAEMRVGFDNINATIAKEQVYAVEIDGRLEEFRELVQTYFTFGTDGLIIGKAGSPFSTLLDNTKLSFRQNGIEIAYIQSNKLYILNAHFIEGITLGADESRCWAFEVDDFGIGIVWRDGNEA